MKLKKLLEIYSADTLYDVYRNIYKYGSGFSVGFLIDGNWVYNDELPKKKLLFQGLRVKKLYLNGYVEGSDVELSPTIFNISTLTEKKLDESIEEIEKEVEFYWNRDNSIWFTIKSKIDEDFEIMGRQTNFNDYPVYYEELEEKEKEKLNILVEKFCENNNNKLETDKYIIEEYYNCEVY